MQFGLYHLKFNRNDLSLACSLWGFWVLSLSLSCWLPAPCGLSLPPNSWRVPKDTPGVPAFSQICYGTTVVHSIVTAAVYWGFPSKLCLAANSSG